MTFIQGDCIDCGATLRASKSGRCRVCSTRRSNACPELRAKRAAGNKRKHADPEYSARHADACRRGKLRAIATNPEYAAKLQELGRRVRAFNYQQTPDERARAIEATRRYHLSWCPEDLWPLNQTLKRKGYRLSERKAIILDTVPGSAEHAARAIANTNLAMRLKQEREKAQAY